MYTSINAAADSAAIHPSIRYQVHTNLGLGKIMAVVPMITSTQEMQIGLADRVIKVPANLNWMRMFVRKFIWVLLRQMVRQKEMSPTPKRE